MPKHVRPFIQKIVAALLVLFQLCLACAGSLATTVDNVNVTAASLTSSTAPISGMVRVYLSSMGSPTTLNLTISGNYSVNGNTSQSLSSGSTATVGFSASTGAITFTYNGVKTNMGTYFALRRHSAAGSNGIKISQAKESANPYPGDLSFQAVRQSSGSYKLYTVAHIYIENYLYGVLPYEMGNSSNIEALKAQAVAARTYTVRMMQSRSSGYYDVVDTTSDQVYRGTPSGNANCVAAVDATKGIVLKYGSAYTMTYYSASNGGQTESAQNAWGSGGYDYLIVKDDPFDYANTSSTVKSKVIYKDLASASNPSALISLLKTKAISALNAAGYSATSANTTLLTLKSVTPHTPKYAAPSKLYTKIDFSLTAQTQSASGSGATAAVTVTCDIFGELESLLSMSIQTSKNELWSVKTASSSFTLQARRYGHGLGMSQRGAMYMGKLGYTYDEILGFYYTGCKRVRQSFTNTILSAVSGSEETTVEEAADLTEESASACKGTVKLVSSGSALAIRASKSTSASMVGSLGNGAIVNVLTNDGTWCYIQYGSLKGYVPANALSISGAPSGVEGEASSILGFATVTASDYVNLRQSAGMSAAILSTAPNGAVLTVFSAADGWAYVQYCSTVAYVNASFISSVTSAYPSGVVSTGSATAVVATEDGTGSVNLRASASTGGAVLAQAPNGAQVTVSSDDGSWASVVYNGTAGYIMSAYLKYDGESLDNNTADSSGGTGSAGNTGGEAAVYATVSADIAYLREQASEESASKLLLAKGDTLQVTQKGSQWCGVTYNGVTGYLLTSALTFAGGEVAAVAHAVVNTSSGSLNMRAEAKAGSAILTTIPKGAQVDVTSVGATWCGVSYLSLNGYVMTSFLSFTDGGATGGTTGGEASGSETLATVTTQSGSLNLRAEARSGSAILLTIPQYATITVHTKASDWCYVSYGTATGYVMTVFLTFAAEGGSLITPTPTPAPTPDSAGETSPDPNNPDEPLISDTTKSLYAKVTTASGGLNLRMYALTGSAVLTTIPRGTTIAVSEKLAAWSQTSYAGLTGYVMNAYLTFIEGAPFVGAGESATVSTPSGSLNLRTEPNAGSGVICRIPQYAVVTVLQRGDPWCYLRYNDHYGYAMTCYLALSAVTQPTATPTPAPTVNGATPTPSPTAADGATPTPAPTQTPQAVKTATVVTPSGSLNLRYAPQAGARVLLAIPQGGVVTVLSEGDEWCQVSYNTTTGYAMTKFLSLSATGTTATAAPSTGASTGEYTATVSTASGGLNLRQTPVSGAKVLLVIPRLAQVTVLSENSGWSTIRYNGFEGYALSSFLSKQAASLSAATPSPTPAPSAAEGAQASNTPTLSPTPSPSPTPAPSFDPSWVVDASLKAVAKKTIAFIEPPENQEMLIVWEQCRESGRELAKLARGAQVEVLMLGDSWCYIEYPDGGAAKTGFCLAACLSVQGN